MGREIPKIDGSNAIINTTSVMRALAVRPLIIFMSFMITSFRSFDAKPAIIRQFLQVYSTAIFYVIPAT